MVTFSNHLEKAFIDSWIKEQLKEDLVFENLKYLRDLPQNLVQCELKIKSPLVMAGLPYFVQCFESFTDKIEYNSKLLEELEGKSFLDGQGHAENILFQIPFSVALTVERFALNILHRSCAIATSTRQFVEKTQNYNIKILDTRKTQIGLRPWEKYAVRVGGGHNHRYGQTDIFMIKDNHKKVFGGLENALKFFENIGSFYRPVVVEIHDLDELKLAIELKVKHVMLDNFEPSEISKAIKIKPNFMSYEVSGGITLENIAGYCIEGVDAISIGSLTQWPARVDLSFKMDQM